LNKTTKTESEDIQRLTRASILTTK